MFSSEDGASCDLHSTPILLLVARLPPSEMVSVLRCYSYGLSSRLTSVYNLKDISRLIIDGGHCVLTLSCPSSDSSAHPLASAGTEVVTLASSTPHLVT